MNVHAININQGDNIAFVGDLHCDTLVPSSRIDNYLETTKNKILDILESCKAHNIKVLFFAGDIFHRIQTPHETVNEIGEVFMRFRDEGIRVFTIKGNHDILRNSLDDFQRSPLQTLLTFGAMTSFSRENPVIINKSVLVMGLDYTDNALPKAVEAAKCNILVAHRFYEASDMLDDGSHNITHEQASKLRYDMIFLGHDHEPHKDVLVDGKTSIIRSGSITRGTMHNYNFNRIPYFVMLKNPLEYDRKNIIQIPIKCKPYSEIASSAALNKKMGDSLEGLQDVLSNLAEKLAEGSETDGDRIMHIIESDDKLSSSCRAMLLKYISESA